MAVRRQQATGVALLWLAASGTALAQEAMKRLPPVQVQALRLGVAPFELPASFNSVVVAPGAQGQATTSLSELVGGVPGLLARERQNLAQDEQVSIRGFGARASFGVRGVRLYADGIPATMPDGQGQLSHFPLGTADRVEVLRGPFSALYGNSSGGVVQVWSADGEAVPVTTLGLFGGSDARIKSAVDTRGIAGPLNYNLALSSYRTDGYRAHSRARRDAGNAKLGFDLGEGRSLTLVANTLWQPYAQDPLGLTRAQYQANPRQALAVATQYGTGKRVRQNQLGATYRQAAGAHSEWRLMGYAGRRSVLQMLSIPPSAQRSALSAGGVIDLAGNYGGADARWSGRGQWLGRPLELVLGISADVQEQQRRGYENFVGDTLGVRGRLRRDEGNRVRDLDQYAQLYWRLAAQWSLLAGVRHSSVQFDARDRYITQANPDDSGRVRYRATTPVLGLQYRPHAHWRLYASAGEGFETPTFAELGYRADGGAGLAFDLRPARSRNYELGAKWQVQPALQFELALFRADTRDELAVAASSGGRSSYRNLGRSRRQGVEAALRHELGDHWRMQFAITGLQANHRGNTGDCRAAACAVFAPAGARIPGVPRERATVRLERGAALGWRIGATFDAIGKVAVDDRNSAWAPGYLVAAFDAGYGLRLGATTLHLSARVDNLFDRRLVGSVIVNDGNGRFYEPAPGRSVLLGMRLQL